MAKVALDKIAAGGTTPYLSTKLVTGRFFMNGCCRKPRLILARIQSGKRDHHGMAADAFLIGEKIPQSLLHAIGDNLFIERYVGDHIIDPHTGRASCLRPISTITFAPRAAAARRTARCTR